MNIHASDKTLAIDDKSAWHRQCPQFVTIKSNEIYSKTAVQLPELPWQGKHKTEPRGDGIVFINQHGKGKMFLFNNLLRVFFELWGDDDNGGAKCFNILRYFLQSFQLRVAVRSINTSVKTDNKGTLID
jgi:hypothetical protein